MVPPWEGLRSEENTERSEHSGKARPSLGQGRAGAQPNMAQHSSSQEPTSPWATGDPAAPTMYLGVTQFCRAPVQVTPLVLKPSAPISDPNSGIQPAFCQGHPARAGDQHNPNVLEPVGQESGSREEQTGSSRLPLPLQDSLKLSPSLW